MNKKLNHTSQTPPYYFWYSVVYVVYPKKESVLLEIKLFAIVWAV